MSEEIDKNITGDEPELKTAEEESENQLDLLDTYQMDLLPQIRVSANLIRDWNEHYGKLPLVQQVFSTSSHDIHLEDKKKIYRDVLTILVQLAERHPIKPISSLYLVLPGVIGQVLLTRWLLDHPKAKEANEFSRLFNTLRQIIKDAYAVAGMSEEITRNITVHEQILIDRTAHETEELFRRAQDMTMESMKEKKLINDLVVSSFINEFEDNLKKAALTETAKVNHEYSPT